MSDPSLEILSAVVGALKAEPAVAALVADRVYDRAPQRVMFPFVRVPDIQIINDDAECIDAFEVYIDVHVFSRSYGSVEARQVCSAAHTALHDNQLTLPSYVMVEMRHAVTRVLLDPDGETSHGIITFRALVDRL